VVTTQIDDCLWTGKSIINYYGCWSLIASMLSL